MSLTINERLNLVLPLYDAQEQVYAYVHSTPISREVFEANFLLISKTFAAIHGEGLGEIAGPRISALMMRTVAQRMVDDKTDPNVVTAPLMNEIRRLTNVLVANEGRWEIVPFQEAISKKMFRDDDFAEVENALVFFTVLSAMHRRKALESLLSGAARLWGAQISSLGCMAFIDSLPTSTETELTGPKLTDITLPPPEPPLHPFPSSPVREAGPVVSIEGVRRAASSLPL